MRERTLAAAGAIALVSLVIAIVVIVSEAQSVKPKAEGLLFPGLQARLSDVNRIEVTTAGARFSMEAQGGQWVMPEKDGYPVAIEKARRLVSGMAEAERQEAKTAEPSLYGRIGVGDPKDDSQARKVAVFDKGGTALASLIVGKKQMTTGGPDVARTFVRIDGRPRAWLVTGLGDIPPKPVDWLRPDFPTMQPARVMAVTVDHPADDKEGEDVTILKATPKDSHFAVKDMPATHELRSEAAADVLGNAFASLRFEDVMKADKRPTDLAVTTVTAEGFDGLVLTFSITGTDGDHWTTVAASVDEAQKKNFEEGDGAAAIPASDDPGKEAQDINAKFGGWAFHLPRFQALDLLKYKHSFIQPKSQPESGKK
jgi:hypothetical protein